MTSARSKLTGATAAMNDRSSRSDTGCSVEASGTASFPDATDGWESCSNPLLLLTSATERRLLERVPCASAIQVRVAGGVRGRPCAPAGSGDEAPVSRPGGVDDHGGGFGPAEPPAGRVREIDAERF